MRIFASVLIVSGLALFSFASPTLATTEEQQIGCIDDFGLNECQKVCPLNKPNCSASAPPGCNPCKK